MSTKDIIKQGSEDLVSYQLYEDCLETLDGNKNAPVYLELSSVPFDVSVLENGNTFVTLKLPRKIAQKLGLI